MYISLRFNNTILKIDSILEKVKKEIETDICLYTTEWIFYRFDFIIDNPHNRIIIEYNNPKLLASSSCNVWQ